MPETKRRKVEARATHTPGPWTVRSGRDTSKPLTIDGCDCMVMAPKTMTRGHKYCEIPAFINGKENAALISAAPDMLAACKAALKRLTTDGYEKSHAGGEVLTKLEKAIAKAEGR